MLSFVNGQVRVRNNNNQKIRRVLIQFQLATNGPWFDAEGNFFIPSTAKRLRFIIDAARDDQRRLRARLELRQICPVPDNGDIEVSRQLLLFASTGRLEGNQHDEQMPSGNRRFFHLEIQTDPPEGSLNPAAHDFCQGNGDHLGEGPYQALITAGTPPTMLNGNDTLNLTYTQEFQTVSARRFKRLQLTERLNPGSVRPRPRRRR
jgi:hypothetical protein